MASKRWYEEGADAVAKVVAGLPRGYLCPLCLGPFSTDRINELTVDHVPAQQVGGNRLVLTCDRCNHSSGASIQADMRNCDIAAAVFSGQIPDPHPVKVTLSSGASMHVNLLRTAGGYELRGVQEADSGAARAEFISQIGTIAESGSLDWSMNVNFYRDRFHPIAASVGWLREAYLVAFAVLGYRYILDRALAIVRDQLADPRAELIKTFMIVAPNTSRDTRHFCMIETPEVLRSVAVQFGQRTIFLPRIGDVGFYERLSKFRGGCDQLSDVAVTGGVLDANPSWPREPLYLMDRHLHNPCFTATSRQSQDTEVTSSAK